MTALVLPADADLITQVLAGDINAFETLVDRHGPRVRACIALRAPIPEVIDELSHEAFVFAYRNLSRFDLDSSFPAWICAIALQLLRAEQQRFRREERRQARYADHVLIEHALQTAETAEPAEIEWLEYCIDKLTPRMRELLDLRYKGALSAEEIATQIRQSIAWVRTTLFRVRQQLRNCLEHLSTPT